MGFERLRVGDVVVRMLAGTLPMKLQVSDITDQREFPATVRDIA
jgi:hypothetical protein